MPKPLVPFEDAIAERVRRECEKHPDPSHDFLHVLRVVTLAKRLAQTEKADLEVVVPAAYLHDVVIISKQDPRRAQASRLSAVEASQFLSKLGYSAPLIPQIAHAIEAHSFSANIPAQTLEAKVVQDADRLDGLGAIGIARCFSLGGLFGNPFYDEAEPLARTRPLDDKANTLDHFFVKLLKLQDKLQTTAGRAEGQRRTQFLQAFLEQLKLEIF
jgi:uncharacterized protein